MNSSPFLSVPFEIREQIYGFTDILYCSPRLHEEPSKAPSSTLCKLIFVNKQLHKEVKSFLRLKLCVLVKTNHTSFLEESFRYNDGGRMPNPSPRPLGECLLVISQLRSEDHAIEKSASNAPIAMELDFHRPHGGDPLAKSFSTFLISASSNGALLEVVKMVSSTSASQRASASFDLVDVFSHSLENAMRLLLKPWLDAAPSIVSLVGVRASSNIPEALVVQLKKELVGECKAVDLLESAEMWRVVGTRRPYPPPYFLHAHSKAAKYATIVWTWHLECLLTLDANSDGNLLFDLWITTITNSCDLIQAVINFIVSEEGGSVPKNPIYRRSLERARRTAEGWISFMSAQSISLDQVMGDEVLKKGIREQKARICFKLHLACKSMEDFGAAMGYLEEAMRHEPESEKMLREEMEVVRREALGDVGEAKFPVVRWGGVDSE